MRHNKENQSPLSPSPSQSKPSDQDPGVEETSYHQSGVESTKISPKNYKLITNKSREITLFRKEKSNLQNSSK